MPFYVYIIQSEIDGSYYIGSAQDIVERLERHNQGRSKYTKHKRPWQLVYCEEHPDRSSAMKQENQIKRQKSKEAIETLVRTSRQV
ncbi:MAG: GIY-YIG nuclease family protein [Deltaproteobacteria bacterium]|nr:MAG: GIY-YIG nuclease family protein [Deltaproteobacteria bacterium]